MRFTPKQKQQFREDGYIVVPGAVPQSHIRAARRMINWELGQKGIDPSKLTQYRAQSYVPDLRGESLLTSLFNDTTLYPLMESLLGEGQVNKAGGVQLALRFPTAPFTDVGAPNGHLDGIGSGSNGTDKGAYTRGFTALATIYLQDVPEENSGNFTVFPGSHRTVEAYLQEHGHEALRNGCPRIDWPKPPVQITGKAGDAVISHHQIIHTAAPNASPDIRYAAIFRVSCAMTKEFGLGALTDIWHEWQGLKDIEVKEASTSIY